MLKLYEYDESVPGYVELSMGTMLRPLSVVANSLRVQDSRITRRIYLRNDEDDTQYTNIELQFLGIPSSWKGKMIAQASEPNEETFQALANGNIVSHANITDQAYHPIWVEIIVPQGTPPAIFSKMRINVSGTRKVV
jgi:hypothetical protein